MHRRTFLGTLGSAVLARRALAKPSKTSHTHELMAGYVERGEIPGIVTVVSRRGDVRVDTLGKQALGAARKMQRDSIFRISSMTKPIVAAATMMLVEEKKLALDEPVDRLLPELAHRKVLRRIDSPLDDTVPAKRPISVRDVLTFRLGHGVILAPPDKYPIQQAMKKQGLAIPIWPGETSLTLDQFIQRLGTLPLLHQPGEGWHYHTGADVLGVLIARASGKPLETFLRERIFSPLGMKDTAFSVPAEKLGRFTACYHQDPQKKALQLFDAPQGQWSKPPSFASGGGGLVSTADDCLAFARMMLDKGKHGRERLLSEATVQAMTTNQLTPEQLAAASMIVGPSGGWGLGLGVTTKPDAYSPPGRYGWNGGLGTTWWNDPGRELITILLTERVFESADPPSVCRDFWKATFQAMEG
jgi:CubicO group peptidase (beta-lactamase class C family)